MNPSDPEGRKHWIPADEVPYGILRISADGRILEANHSLAEMLGYSSREELMQLSARELFFDPEDRERVMSQFPLQIKGVELIWNRRDGTPIPIQLSGRMIYDAQGKLSELEGIVLDWSPQREALDVLRLQRDLAINLSAAGDFSAIIEALLETVLQLEGVDGAGIYLLDPATGSLQLRAAKGGSEYLLQTIRSYPPESEKTRKLMQGGTLYAKPRDLSPPIAEAFLREDVRFVGIVPVQDKGRVVASLNFISRTQDFVSLATRHAVEVIAQWIGRSVARVQAEEALKASQQNLQNLFDSLPDLVFIVDEDFKLLDVNPAVEKRLGYRKEELLGKNISIVHPPEPQSEVLAVQARIYRGEQTLVSRPFIAKDGALIPAETWVVRGYWGGKSVAFGLGRDLSEIHKTLRALQESEQRFRAVFENAAIGLVLTDLEGKILEANSMICQLSWLPPEKILGRNYRDFVHPEDLEALEEQLQRLLNEQLPWVQWEGQHLRADGTAHWGRVTFSLMTLSDGALQEIVAIVEDIDPRKQAEKALRQSESRLEHIIASLPDVLVVTDLEGTVRFANHANPHMTPESAPGISIPLLAAEEYREEVRRAYAQCAARKIVQDLVARDVKDLWWRVRIIPLIEEDEVRELIIFASDITAQQKAQEAVLSEQRLLRRLLELQERDRQMTAYELHDGFAQQLAAALLYLENYLGLREGDPALAERQFHDGLKLIRRGLDEVRRLISGLRPLILDEAGVLQAVEYLVAEQRQRTGQEIVFKHDVRFRRLAPLLETAVFRIVQESLGNACRHSRSDFIRIELYQAAEQLHIKVVDEGVGFDPEKVAPERFGLRGIRERARLLDGQAVIHSQSGEGTTVHVILPLVYPAETKDEG
ncbi:MAG: PAS domain S-box protein [Pirellulales bacterium]|nr:PAS domain S-box protein [Pirellulales bacterium]